LSAWQLCGALHEAHGVGLIHRDVKPGNVLVCRHVVQAAVVKLLDFGLVRKVGGAAGTQPLTEEHLVLGTPDYIAPEQARGAAALDGRSDLYSLGALAYFLLTGAPPFDGASVLEKLFAHIHQPVRRRGCCARTCRRTCSRSFCAAWRRIPPGASRIPPHWSRAWRRAAVQGQWSQEDAAACWSGQPLAAPGLASALQERWPGFPRGDFFLTKAPVSLSSTTAFPAPGSS